ncbi:MAG: radical SAM protein [Clostridia bacterium]|nr:radical SAM protein [Clostridia bacterium]
MNIYKGCSHGCIYCDSRSECYRVEDFDTVRAKEDALAVIERDLRSKRRKGVVITGSMSDPYNPLEGSLRLTRGALELIDRHRFGIVADTKSDRVVRDIDVLSSIRTHSPAVVNFTVTAADDALCRLIEPNVCPTSARFAAMKRLTDAGIRCGILLMPILPFITDSVENILSIVRTAHANGASHIYRAFGVTLRQNQREYFLDRLSERFPGLRPRYAREFGQTYACVSPSEPELQRAFRSECDRLGLLYRMREISEAVRGTYYEDRQTRLF